jgi:hypothetical protein
MNKWHQSAGIAALLLLTTALPAFAAAAQPEVIKAPVPLQEVGAQRALPAAITWGDQVLSFDAKPVLQEQVLYVPLRFIAEAAGGKVAWDATTQSVIVTLPDRTASFTIGQAEAELNMRGVMYIKRNMIKLAGPVQIIEGRTMISADALTSILGLMERADKDLNLDLMPALTDGEMHVEIVPTGVEAAAAPDELVAWAGAQPIEGGTATYKVVTTPQGRYLAIAGGQQPTGGHRIEIVGAKREGDKWVIQAQVVAPDGPAIMILTNPVAYFQLDGIEGDVEVQFITDAGTNQ